MGSGEPGMPLVKGKKLSPCELWLSIDGGKLSGCCGAAPTDFSISV